MLISKEKFMHKEFKNLASRENICILKLDNRSTNNIGRQQQRMLNEAATN
jgi:hypothetical protein